MSYDLNIAAHHKPDQQTFETSVRANGLEIVAAADRDSLTVQRTGKGHVCEIWGPYAAEPEDFDERLAAACLAPKWMLQVSVPYSISKTNLALARALARHLAVSTSGAAFDPQEERLLWPRGKTRTPARSDGVETAMLKVSWFVAPSRWRAAVAALVPLIAYRCPEALPTRYGSFEPPPHRFERADPEPFVRFLVESDHGEGFWYASPPGFGGSFTAPHTDKYAKPEDERFRVGRLDLNFDADRISTDQRRLESIVDLFAHGAETFGAFFAAAQVEPGWTVRRGNRAFAQPASLQEGEHFLCGRLWQGLPPVPVWLSWYGGTYRDLLRDALERTPQPLPSRKPALLARLQARRAQARAQIEVDDRGSGFFVRLAQLPQPRGALPQLALPTELVYRERRAIRNASGHRGSNPAQREDRAQLIPPLDDTSRRRRGA